MHVTTMTVIIVERIVKQASVIPHRERPLSPMKTRYKLVLSQMRREIGNDCFALFSGPTLYPMRVGSTTVNTFATGLWMRSDQRMLNLGFCKLVVTSVRATQLAFG